MSLLRVISARKAAGLGTVAGGLSEALVIWGVVSVLACEIYAVTLLSGSFASGHTLRSLTAVVSIVCGVVVIIALGAMFIVLSRL